MYELIGLGVEFIGSNIVAELNKVRARERRIKQLEELRNIVRNDKSGEMEKIIQKHFRINLTRDFSQVYLYYFFETFPYFMLLVFGVYIFSRYSLFDQGK